jgi:hypothetical protein
MQEVQMYKINAEVEGKDLTIYAEQSFKMAGNEKCAFCDQAAVGCVYVEIKEVVDNSDYSETRLDDEIFFKVVELVEQVLQKNVSICGSDKCLHRLEHNESETAKAFNCISSASI